MKILYLKLKNYIGIKAGMGLDEIEIDFYKTIHPICVIKGDNGSGKSTLLKALSPMNDSPSDFVEGTIAEKKIVYLLDNGRKLHIHHVFTPSPRTNRVYIHLDAPGEYIDLNPTGNMTEGRTIICDQLGIDADFLLLSQLSSEDRGLVDKTPAERKKFINNKMEQMQYFNQLYKKISNKYNDLKAMLKSINVKLQDIGSVETLKSSITSLTESLGGLEDQRNNMLIRYATYQEKLCSYEKYDVPVVDRYKEVDKVMSQALQEVYDCDKRLEDLSKYKLDSLDQEYSSLELHMTSLSSTEKRLSELRTQHTELYKSIERNTEKLKKFGDIELFKKSETYLAEKMKQNHYYKKRFLELGFDTSCNILPAEYESALNSVEFYNNRMQYIVDKYPLMFREAMLDNEQQQTLLTGKDTKIEEELTKQLKEVKERLQDQATYKNDSKLYDLIPKDCAHLSDCPFIQKAVNSKYSLLSEEEIENMNVLMETITKMIQANRNRDATRNTMLECMNDYRELELNMDLKSLSKFPGLDWVLDKRKLYIALANATEIHLDLVAYRERSNLLTLLRENEKVIVNLKRNVDAYRVNRELIDMIQKEIEDNEKEYQRIDEMIQMTESHKLEEESVLEDIKTRIKLCKEKEEIEERRKDKNKIVEDLHEEFQNLRNVMEELQEIKENMEIVHKKLECLNTVDIPKVQDELQKNKYQMVLYREYLKEYEKYTRELEWIEKLRYYVAPTTGIQTAYMEMFMNEILTTANQLIRLFFNGEYVLQPFVINEREFRIPCIGGKIIHDDITSMSTAQICMISMILSFALFSTSSSSYSIIKLDEIDGGLDYNNRMQFITVLHNLMMMLKYEQCIMISHNSELELYNADVILLKSTDKDLNLTGANVIWSYGG